MMKALWHKFWVKYHHIVRRHYYLKNNIKKANYHTNQKIYHVRKLEKMGYIVLFGS